MALWKTKLSLRRTLGALRKTINSHINNTIPDKAISTKELDDITLSTRPTKKTKCVIMFNSYVCYEVYQ